MGSPTFLLLALGLVAYSLLNNLIWHGPNNYNNFFKYSVKL